MGRFRVFRWHSLQFSSTRRVPEVGRAGIGDSGARVESMERKKEADVSRGPDPPERNPHAIRQNSNCVVAESALTLDQA